MNNEKSVNSFGVDRFFVRIWQCQDLFAAMDSNSFPDT